MSLPDVIGDNLDIVFCGSAVGHMSKAKGAYYARPGNRFWSALFNVGLTPKMLIPADFRQLLQYHLGLTDLVKDVSGNDKSLTKDHFDVPRFRTLIMKHVPRIVAFTGKKPAKEFLGVQSVQYGKQEKALGDTLLFVLPSPSGAARRYWSETPWLELSRLRDELVASENRI